jgi:WD40 repeat protein
MPAPSPASGPPARRRPNAGAIVALLMGAFVVAASGFAAGWLLASRRIVLAEKSLGGEAVAFVLEGRCAAGLCQTLRIGPTASNANVVESLSGPDEQATEIAWAPDGGRVGFLVNGYQLRVFDAHTGKNLGAINIVTPDGSPSTRIARGVTFSTNGAAITFDDCPRDHSGCKPGMLAVKNQ